MQSGITPASRDLANIKAGLTLKPSALSIAVAPGFAVSDDGGEFMILGEGYSKTTALWVAGPGNGALDTGTVANNTWYHVFLIKRTDTGVVDLLFSLHSTSPTLPERYTKKRRVGAFRVDGSGSIVPFKNVGNQFIWHDRSTSLRLCDG